MNFTCLLCNKAVIQFAIEVTCLKEYDLKLCGRAKSGEKRTVVGDLSRDVIALST